MAHRLESGVVPGIFRILMPNWRRFHPETPSWNSYDVACFAPMRFCSSTGNNSLNLHIKCLIRVTLLNFYSVIASIGCCVIVCHFEINIVPRENLAKHNGKFKSFKITLHIVTALPLLYCLMSMHYAHVALSHSEKITRYLLNIKGDYFDNPFMLADANIEALLLQVFCCVYKLMQSKVLIKITLKIQQKLFKAQTVTFITLEYMIHTVFLKHFKSPKKW